MSNNYQAKRWVFTLNNWTELEYSHILNNLDNYDYIVVGKEVGEQGTPHLQGFVILKTKLRLNQVKRLLCQRCHLEICRGTPEQASDYCKKDNDFVEHGTLPAKQPKRPTEFERFRDWVLEQEAPISERALILKFPSLYGRYYGALKRIIAVLGPKPDLVRGELREWQQHMLEVVDGEPDDRGINFVVDPEGGKGKSWFTRYMLTTHDNCQRLSVGKRDDLAYAIDPEKRIFLFDIPRGQSEYLQYGVLEGLKDQMIFSPKYESASKILHDKVHVVVFMNEEPDLNAMTGDRYKITRL